jgi:hypothetical protein
MCPSAPILNGSTTVTERSSIEINMGHLLHGLQKSAGFGLSASNQVKSLPSGCELAGQNSIDGA